MPESPVPAPSGFRIVTANLGVKDETTDFCLVVSDRPATSAGVYTQSRFAGPSVALSRAATASGAARGVVVISKNANVANGVQGEVESKWREPGPPDGGVQEAAELGDRRRRRHCHRRDRIRPY